MASVFTVKQISVDGSIETLGQYDEWFDAISKVFDSLCRQQLTIEERKFESDDVHVFHFDQDAKITSVDHNYCEIDTCKYADLDSLNK